MGTGVPQGVPRVIPEVLPLVSHPLDTLMREAVVKTMSNENISPCVFVLQGGGCWWHR